MGSLILCVGKKAEKPFTFWDTHTEVYTLEEMCYYVYQYIDTITDEIFDETMVEWLGTQAGMEELSSKIERLINNKNSLKDKIVTLLCGCDYYREKEIRQLLVIMDQLEKMSFFERCKQKGNYFLENGRYREAENFLLEMLKSENAKQFTTKEYGDILHNLAVIHVHTASYGEAAKEFKDAYERNQRRETLKQYFIALKLAEQKELYQSELVQLEVDEELKEEIETEFGEKLTEATRLPEYEQLKRLANMKNQGKVSAYYEAVNQIIEKWKQEYKEEAVG